MVKELPGVGDFLSGAPSGVPQRIADLVSVAFDASATVLLLDHMDHVRFFLTAAYPDTENGFPAEVESGSLLEVVQDHAPVCGPRAGWEGLVPLEDPYLAAVPLTLRNTAIGVLAAGKSEPFTGEEQESLAFLGGEAGAAVELAARYTDSIDVARRRATPSLAAELQSAQLPPRSLHDRRVEVTGAVEPAYEVGGDWFDYALDGDRLFVAVCDGVGRDLVATNVSYLTLGAVRNARRRGADLPGILESTHRTLVESTSEEQFATLVMAFIYLDSYEMEIISAAHPPPLFFPADPTQPSGALDISGGLYPPVGAFDTKTGYTVERQVLEPGSRLLFFSDGAPERLDADHRQLGTDGLLHYADSRRKLRRRAFTGGLMRDVMNHGDSQIQDDVTVLSVDLPEAASGRQTR